MKRPKFEDIPFEDMPLDCEKSYLEYRNEYWNMLAEIDDTYAEDYM